MALEQSLAFLAFALVAAITPGPSNVMITATGSAVGKWRGLPCALGAAFGMGLLLFLSALGELVRSRPMIITALNWGATVLKGKRFWLPWFALPYDCIEDCEEFSGHGNKNDHLWFACLEKAQ